MHICGHNKKSINFSLVKRHTCPATLTTRPAPDFVRAKYSSGHYIIDIKALKEFQINVFTLFTLLQKQNAT